MIATSNDTFFIRLTARNEFGSTQSFDLQSDQGVFVGRSSNCGLQIPGTNVNDIHCRIGFEEGNLTVQDWMSSGIAVNGVPVDSSANLKEGDAIQIGGYKIHIGPKTSLNAAPEQSETGDQAPAPEHFNQVAEVFTQRNDPAAENIAEQVAFCEGNNDLDDAEFPVSHKGDDTTSSEPSQSDLFDQGRTESAGLRDDSPMEFEVDHADWEGEQTFDRETVDLLRAEIEELQSALAQQDANSLNAANLESIADPITPTDNGRMEQRIKDLIEDANRSDERVALLEEMLHAAEDSNRNEREERNQLEAWVSEIETRITQREEESAAEIQTLQIRLEQSQQEQDQLRRRLGKAASSGSAPRQYEETLDNLQRSNHNLQKQLDQSQKERHALQQQLKDSSSRHENVIREERANIAKEQARLSRLRYELSSKVADVESLPKETNIAETQTSEKIQALRQHLREIHEQEKKEEAEGSLTSRLAKLWKRVEY